MFDPLRYFTKKSLLALILLVNILQLFVAVKFAHRNIAINLSCPVGQDFSDPRQGP